MKIYISIPISGKDLRKQREHADLLKVSLSRQGHTVVTPFEVYAGKNPGYEDYICYDLLAMLSCDAVFFCQGWQKSCGCSIEHSVVRLMSQFGKRRIKIIYEQ